MSNITRQSPGPPARRSPRAHQRRFPTCENTTWPAGSLRLVPIQSRSLPAVSFLGLDCVKSLMDRHPPIQNGQHQQATNFPFRKPTPFWQVCSHGLPRRAIAETHLGRRLGRRLHYCLRYLRTERRRRRFRFCSGFLAGVTFVLWFTLLRRNQLRTAGLDQVDTMSGVEFERYVAAVLQGLGYTAIEYTTTTGDFGVDLIATPRRASGGRIRRSARRPPPRLNEFKQPAVG
jgi:hypothetical protein